MRRFTSEEDAIIRRDYAAHVPTIRIARRLNRSNSAIRQRVFYLGMCRSNNITRVMAWAPPHLRAQFDLSEISSQAFLDACYEWRNQQRERNAAAREAETLAHSEAVQAQCAVIDQRADLTRREKIVAKRLAGMTLDAIGKQHGLTRERVRQIAAKVAEPKPTGRPRKSPTSPAPNRVKKMSATQPTVPTEIIIEKNIPLPPRANSYDSKYGGMLRQMEVSDSFYVPKNDPGGSGKSRSWETRVRSWGYSQKPPRRFASRKLPDGGTRFWRVE
jgi:hypothetical protein